MEHEETRQKIKTFFSVYRVRPYRRKDIIIYAEAEVTNVLYVKSGFIRVYRISEQGEELTLMILKTGDIYPLVLNDSRVLENCYLEAVTQVEIITAPQKSFLNFIKNDTDIYFDLISETIERVNGLMSRIEYLVFGNAYTKVASTLLICAKRFGIRDGDNIIVRLPLTHKDIATFVGITRETTCLEMKKLERKGLISHKGRQVIVKNLKKLGDESLLGGEQNRDLDNFL